MRIVGGVDWSAVGRRVGRWWAGSGADSGGPAAGAPPGVGEEAAARVPNRPPRPRAAGGDGPQRLAGLVRGLRDRVGQVHGEVATRRRQPGGAASWVAALALTFAVGLWAGGAAFSQPAGVPSSPGAAPRPVRIVRSAPTAAKAVALTFDDGPSPKYTPQVLDLLKQYGARATFFVIGQEVERFPDLLKAEVAAGSEVGNHGYHHLTLKSVSADQLTAEVQAAEQTLVSLTGAKPTLYRLPGGKSDAASLRALTDMGYTIVMWSVDTRDYVYRPPAAIVSQVEKEVRPGSIVIFHDGGGNQQHTVDALRQLLPWFRDQGYQLVTVSQLLEMPQAGTSR
jgi:peptidoglycan/xylan/chitin deacetylase (PgdA/CDA1 family)